MRHMKGSYVRSQYKLKGKKSHQSACQCCWFYNFKEKELEKELNKELIKATI